VMRIEPAVLGVAAVAGESNLIHGVISGRCANTVVAMISIKKLEIRMPSIK